MSCPPGSGPPTLAAVALQEQVAQALLQHLADKFHIAIRLREVGAGRGYRLYQVRKTGNRHLVDVRPVAQLPAAQRISGVLVLAPAELIAYKTIAYHMRRGQPKSGADWRDADVRAPVRVRLTLPNSERS